jgi:hypothetical protein
VAILAPFCCVGHVSVTVPLDAKAVALRLADAAAVMGMERPSAEQERLAAEAWDWLMLAPADGQRRRVVCAVAAGFSWKAIENVTCLGPALARRRWAEGIAAIVEALGG